MAKEGRIGMVGYALARFVSNKGLKPLLKGEFRDELDGGLFGQTKLPAIHYAATYGNIDALRFFLERNIFDCATLDSKNQTALFHCVNKTTLKQYAPDIIELLIRSNTALNAQNNHNHTTLYEAVMHGHRQFFYRLSHKNGTLVNDASTGRPIINALTENGISLLHHTLKNGDLLSALSLIKAGASLTQTNRQGRTALQQIAHDWNIECQLGRVGASRIKLQNYQKLLDTIVGRNAAILTEDVATRTIIQACQAASTTILAPAPAPLAPSVISVPVPAPLITPVVVLTPQESLSQAVRNGALDTIRALAANPAQNGITIFASDSHGKNFLHIAVGNGHIGVARYLIERLNFNVNQQDYKGNSVLSYAGHIAQNDVFSSMITLLAQNGADQNIRNQTGHTPRDVYNTHQQGLFDATYIPAAAKYLKIRAELARGQHESMMTTMAPAHSSASLLTGNFSTARSSDEDVMKLSLPNNSVDHTSAQFMTPPSKKQGQKRSLFFRDEEEIDLDAGSKMKIEGAKTSSFVEALTLETRAKMVKMEASQGAGAATSRLLDERGCGSDSFSRFQ